MVKPLILFVCSHNSARSQMAEGWLRHMAGDRFEAASAGVEPGRLNPLAVEAMREVGVDIASHRAKSIAEFQDGRPVSCMVTVCDNAATRCPIGWPGVERRVAWSFDDPSAAVGSVAQKLAVFRRVRDEIHARMRQWLATEASAVTSSTPSPDRFMEMAVEEARKGLAEGGIPIGSVLVRGGEVLGRGHNRRVQDNDPITHAEIDCLRNAGRVGSYRDTVLYSTLMPCYLCSGAVVQFEIPRVIVGESVTFPGAPGFMREHGVEVVDLNLESCQRLMREFIAARPDLWNEDIGKL